MGYFQTGWKWCRNCQSLFFSRNRTQGRCARGGAHDGSRSGNYALIAVGRDAPRPDYPRAGSGPYRGQAGWKWCRKCELLFYGIGPGPSACPSGGSHDGSASGYYTVDHLGRRERPPPADPIDRNGEPHQRNWRWCSRCQQLVFAGNRTPGACAAGGEHSRDGYDYVLNIAGPLHEATAATLLVVAPASFQAALAPLIAHKNATRMPAMLVTLEALIAYYLGVDDPEKIKRGIAFAHEYLGTRYVLLAGDASLIPVRYRRTSIPEGARNWRDGWFAPADFYYGNLYSTLVPAAEGGARPGCFATWDSNGDYRFNEQHWENDASRFNPDAVDPVPNVAVGRLPAHNAAEVARYVDKVIGYETRSARSARPLMTVLIDRGYQGADGLAENMIRDSRIATAGPVWTVDRVALDYGSEEQPPPGFRRGDSAGAPVADAAARSFWLTYIGHGWADGWDVHEGAGLVDSARVRTYANGPNLPVVYAAGCDTGQFVNCPPDHKYRDVDGRTHWYWAEPPTETPNRVWDLGDRSPGSPPVREWGIEGGVTPMITAPAPHPYDFPERGTRSVAAAWLFGSSNGGAIAYFGEITTCQNNWATDLATGMLAACTQGENVLGSIWLAGQDAYRRMHLANEDAIGAPRLYLCYMTLFGDPSLRLA